MTAPVREARIDLAAVRGNIRALRELVAPAQVLAVVKAEGYGHGAELVARAALEARAQAAEGARADAKRRELDLRREHDAATGSAPPTSTRRSRCAPRASRRRCSPGCMALRST